MRTQVSPQIRQDEDRVSAPPCRHSDAPTPVSMLLALQSSVGNAATARLVAARRAPLHPHTRSVQREKDKNTKPTEEVRQATDHANKEMSKKGTLGTPPNAVTKEDETSLKTLIHADPKQAEDTMQKADEVSQMYEEERNVLEDASSRSAEEDSDSTEEDSSSSDAVAFVDHRSGPNRRGPEAQATPGARPRTAKATKSDVSEGEAVSQALGTQQSARDLLDTSTRFGAAPAPRIPDDPNAAISQMEEQPNLLRAFIDTADTLFGPGPEATPSAVAAAPGTVLGPVTSTDPGGLGIDGPAADAGGFLGGYAGAQDFLGNVARIATGIVTFAKGWRNHDGVRVLTSKDSRHGLGEIARGFGGASVSLFGLAKSGIEATGGAVSTAANTLAGAAGVVLGTISAVLTTRKAWRARVRKAAARAWQRHGERTGLTFAEDSTDRAERQDRRFWNRLRVAAQLLKRKAARKETRKALGATGAGIGAAGGLVLVIVGGLAVANIWNPVGWALGGVAAAVGIGLGIYRLWRRAKRAKHRREELKSAPSFWTGATKESRVQPKKSSDYARFVVAELDCDKTRKHKHAKGPDGHEKTMEQFVETVLRKKPHKVRNRGEDYIAGKWTTW